jgi:2-oxoglutarate ferredoxin oxidoreductase subunit delta
VSWIEIDEERCKGCYLCIDACPEGNIALSDCLNAGGAYPARYTGNGHCKACTKCARVCPDAAIEVYHEKKPKKEG